jgi:hypothetical protein
VLPAYYAHQYGPIPCHCNKPLLFHENKSLGLVTLGVLILILTITEDLDELRENSGMTSMATLCNLSRIMDLAVDLALAFIVGDLGTEHRWTH